MSRSWRCTHRSATFARCLGLFITALLVSEPQFSNLGLSADPPQESSGKRSGLQLVNTCRHEGEEDVALTLRVEGNRLISTGAQFSRIWEPMTGREIKTISLKGMPHSAIPALGGQVVVGEAGNPDGLRVYDLKTERIRHQFTSGTFRWVVSPDGRTVVSTNSSGPLRLCDIESGKELWKTELPKGKDQTTRCTALAFSPDGRMIAVGLNWGGVVWLLSAATGEERRRLSPPPDVGAHVDCIAFSPNSRLLAASSGLADWDAGVWEVDSGALFRRIKIKREELPPGSRPIVGSDGRPLRNQNGNLIVRDRDGNVISARPQTGAISVAFSPDGRTLLTYPSTHTAIRFWEVATGGCRIEAEDLASSDLAFLPNGLLATAARERVRIWDWRVPVEPVPEPFGKKELDQLWEKLADPDAEVAHKAAAILRARPDQAIGLFAKNLKPMPVTKETVVVRWVNDLDAEDYRTREDAMKGLRNLSEAARPALDAALAKSESPEIKSRIGELIQASRKIPQPARLRVVRAIEVLESIGSDAAVSVIRSMAEGMPAALETEDAKGALGRLLGSKK